jgi:hypothetical protein
MNYSENVSRSAVLESRDKLGVCETAHNSQRADEMHHRNDNEEERGVRVKKFQSTV